MPRNFMNLTDVFPHPVAPMTLRACSVRHSNSENGGGVYAILIGVSICEGQQIGKANELRLWLHESTGPEKACG